MQTQTRLQSAPRRATRAIRPPRAPANNWSKIRHHLPLLVACGLLIAASGYALTAFAEPGDVTAAAPL